MHLELAPNKRYYSIGEIAKAFNVNASLIRFWDKEFDILKPKKNAKGNRMFTPEDVKKFAIDLSFGKGTRIYIRRSQNTFERRSEKNLR